MDRGAWRGARGRRRPASAHADLAAGARYAVYFWGANTTKALHIGHLRNLALGNAIAAALRVGGAKVENRSLICDVGRSMGEAMAGVVASGRADDDLGADGGEKSDHFVGLCYAEYVTAGRRIGAATTAPRTRSPARSALYEDKADELMMRVLAGDQEALELWSKTRAWVISGQRKTLARLGVPFDKVIFESDFLPEVAELTNLGLREGTLRRRADGMVFYPTAREELEEMPLVRADGLPTQHMRALAYWAAAPELDDVISLQVCGTEWVAHVTCRRQLIDALAAASQRPPGPGPTPRGGGPPTHDVFHGMVAREQRSDHLHEEGALLIDDLVEWIEAEIAADPALAAVRAAHPQPDRARGPGRARLLPAAADDSSGSSSSRRSCSTGAQPRLGPGAGAGAPRRPRRRWRPAAGAADPDYRFAVVQSESYRVHLRSAVETSTRCRSPATSRTSAAGTGRRSARPRSSGWRRRCSTGECAASDWRVPDADAAGRQPRLLQLQRLPPAGRRLRHRAGGGQQRRRLLARPLARGLRRDRPLAGPGRPERWHDFGVCRDILRYSEIPVLGICLGHQGIGNLLHGGVNRAPMAMHGRLSRVHHDGTGLFEGVPQDFEVVRYHSLAITSPMGPEGRETAWADDGVVMGIEHRTAADVGRPVPPRVGRHRARPPDRRELLRDGRAPPAHARRGPTRSPPGRSGPRQAERAAGRSRAPPGGPRRLLVRTLRGRGADRAALRTALRRRRGLLLARQRRRPDLARPVLVPWHQRRAATAACSNTTSTAARSTVDRGGGGPSSAARSSSC